MKLVVMVFAGFLTAMSFANALPVENRCFQLHEEVSSSLDFSYQIMEQSRKIAQQGDLTKADQFETIAEEMIEKASHKAQIYQAFCKD